MSGRIEADYLIETSCPLDQAAAAMAGEQSSGTFVAVPGETPELKARATATADALEELGPVEAPPLPGTGRADAPHRRVRVTLSWPLGNLGPSLPNPLATVAGNLFELKQFSGLRLVDLRPPEAFAAACPGPAFGVDGTRRLAGVEGPPADRHDRQALGRAGPGGDGGAGGRTLRGRHRFHQGRRAAVRRPLLPVRGPCPRGG